MSNQDITGNVPTAVWEGTFRVFGVDVRCCVLSDGRKIISTDSMNALLDAMATGTADAGDLEAFARWQRGDAGRG